MFEADLECRRLAHSWKLVTSVLNDALSFDCCVIRPQPGLRTRRNSTRVFGASLPMFAGQVRLKHVSTKRMRLPGFDVTPKLLRSPMAHLAQHLAIAPRVAKSNGMRAMETLGLR